MSNEYSYITTVKSLNRKVKVVSEMRTVHYQPSKIYRGKDILTPTGNYQVVGTKTNNVICTCKSEMLANTLSELLLNHVDEWNELIDAQKENA